MNPHNHIVRSFHHPILQMRELKSRVVKVQDNAQGHSSGKGWNQDVDPGLIPNPLSFNISIGCFLSLNQKRQKFKSIDLCLA